MSNLNIIKNEVKRHYLLGNIEYLYHATPACYIGSIKKYGLGAKVPKRRMWDYSGTDYDDITQGCFLADDEYVAESYVEISENFAELSDWYEERYGKELEIKVFKIKVDDLDLTLLSADSNQQDNEHTFFYGGVIPYDKMEKIDLY